MIVEDEALYLERRAEAELAMAQRASDARAVKVHYDLATAYLDRIHAESPDEPLV